MSDQPTTRKALYERIRKTSKDEVILEEMIRLGFWPASNEMPLTPASEIRQRGELARRLNELLRQQMDLHSEALFKEQARKKRMAGARARRLENRERKLRARSERTEAWRETKKHRIGYLGEGVSGGLGQHEIDGGRLRASGLPLLSTAAELAKAMKIEVGELRFLAYSRKASKQSHYKRFTLPKKSGGTRTISAPMPRLKAAQHWVLQMLVNLPMHDAAHGFRPGRSIVTNAQPHVGADVVVNIDLENFFPSISYRRVKGLFRSYGFSEEVATLLGLLCTEPEVQAIELDEEVFHVAQSERFLPQGAPTSPIISNLLCRRLDPRVAGICNKLGFVYTRYADDLSFSARGPAAKSVGKLLSQVEWIVAEEGFAIHPDKTRIFRNGRRQEVTGLVVNEGLAVPRQTLRRFRSLLHHIEKDGPEGKRWGAGTDVLASCVGFANFVSMVQPDKGEALRQTVGALIKTHGGGPTPPSPAPTASQSPGERASGSAEKSESDGSEAAPKKKSWWKIF